MDDNDMNIINNKPFIITVDTEGDNQWKYKIGDKITTQNAFAIPRFQKICEKYGFKPVYLINYEMINNPSFVDFVSEKASEGKCEIGMHLHAWNTPPEYVLRKEKNEGGLPYLIEYPTEIMDSKVEYLTDLIKKRTGFRPVSHRAGRWAMDSRYFDILAKYNYLVDCSVTPGINWSNCRGYVEGSRGTDYSNHDSAPTYFKCKKGGIWEVPMSISPPYHSFCMKHITSFNELKREIKKLLFGDNIWMRIMDSSINRQIQYANNNEAEYLMFMLHSSELISEGSRYFTTPESVEMFFQNMEKLFSEVHSRYYGATLKEYADSLQNRLGK